MNKGCVFSLCRKYRFTLWREWPIEDLFGECSAETRAHEYLMVIGLNPSTADETNDDPTIRRCIRFAKDWGFGSLCMTNAFAWRDTDPQKMKQEGYPIQPWFQKGNQGQNDYWLQTCADDAGMILAAWSKHGKFMDRDQYIAAMLPPMMCLGRNKDGTPKQPLYIAANTQPVKYST